jgi:LysR family transcriptional regulator, glycine cleavage system transcriptional activator
VAAAYFCSSIQNRSAKSQMLFRRPAWHRTRFINDEFDADIIYGPPRQEGLVVVPLGEETVTPLCSPELARRIRAPRDLYDCVLIESDNKQIRWPVWFARNALPAPRPHGTRFDRSFLAIAAAADGLGVR